MRTIQTILTILTLVTFINASGQVDLGQIPKQVKQTADSLIKLSLGTEYFSRTTFNCENSLIDINGILSLNPCQSNEAKKKSNRKNKVDLRPQFYVLKYQLELLDNSKFKFEVRINKNLELREKINLPDCANTNACKITVDSLSAIDHALKSGLVKGLGVYNDGLIFDSETNTFQWKIKNHLKTMPDKGDLIYIDAVTGQRLVDKDEQWLRSVVH